MQTLGAIYQIGRDVPRDIQEALRWYKLAANQGDVNAQFNLGTAFMIQGKLDNAEKYFLKCLELNGRFKPALFNLALVKQKQLYWQESIKRFNNYIAVAGLSPSVLNQIGFNYLNLNDLPKAKSFLQRSLKISSTNINTLVLLGDVFSAQGMAQEAEKNYRMALNLNKDSKREELLKNKIMEIKKIISK